MIYQDKWLNGSCIEKGIRNCDTRYNLVSGHLAEYPPKTVLDIGANMCYFGLRLIEDFNCNVMAFEFNSFKMRKEHVDKNKTKQLIFLERKLSIKDINVLSSFCHFDLVLAMSVIHHLPGDTQEWMSAMRKIGDQVIIEFAGEDSTRPEVRKNYFIPDGGTVIGYGDSHLKSNFQRPIISFI